MAKRTIRGELSVKGIQSIIDQLREYKQELNDKMELFCRKLAEAGLAVAESNIAKSPLGKTISVRINMESSKAGCKAMLIAHGQKQTDERGRTASTLLLVEFGAGIHYNSNENPKASEMGYGVGTFPGQVHAFEDGWYYWGEDEKWHYTHGIKATMPMYNASVAIREKVKECVKEVFGYA